MAGSRCGASTSAGSAFGARAGIASFRCTWASHDHRAVAVRSDLRQEFCDIGVGGRAVAPDIKRGRYRAWRHGPYPTAEPSARRESGSHNDVLTEETRGRRPRYYLQNFHFQTGGWMTDDSAGRYDTQVEVLFNGTANATRRQALPQLHEVFAGRDQRRLRLLDIGCGTGRFLDFVKQAWPRLPTVGLDMSEPYVRYARRHLKRWSRINLTVGNAESLPVPDEVASFFANVPAC